MYLMNGNCSSYGCGNGGEMRRFLTSEEKIEMLKEYKEYLDKESKGVAERIKELQKNTED